MGENKSLEKIELDNLIKQILKTIENKEEIKAKEIEKSKEVTKEVEDTAENTETEESTEKIKDLSDFLKELEKNNKMEFSELTYDLGMKELMPVSYKLKIHYGGEVFEGYYERAMDSMKKTKETTYSHMGREIETETLQNCLIIIKNAKEHKSDNLLLDSTKKAAVDAYKWQNITWWQMLYELEGKVIF